MVKNSGATTATMARNGPALERALADTRIAVQQAGQAAEQIGSLAAATQGTIDRNVDPAMRNLRDTLASANESMKTLEGAIADARPGLKTFSRSEEHTSEIQSLMR